MSECKWMQGETCMNEDCPMFCGCCHVADEPEECGFYEPEEIEEGQGNG